MNRMREPLFRASINQPISTWQGGRICLHQSLRWWATWTSGRSPDSHKHHSFCMPGFFKWFFAHFQYCQIVKNYTKVVLVLIHTSTIHVLGHLVNLQIFQDFSNDFLRFQYCQIINNLTKGVIVLIHTSTIHVLGHLVKLQIFKEKKEN